LVAFSVAGKAFENDTAVADIEEVFKVPKK
jgi:hypothetical protein